METKGANLHIRVKSFFSTNNSYHVESWCILLLVRLIKLFSCSSTSRGYAAGYYSYKWADVLSADAFSAFEDAGLDDIKAVKETGQRFRNTILSLGGGKAPLRAPIIASLRVYVEFRSREPSPELLLRHNGLLAGLSFF